MSEVRKRDRGNMEITENREQRTENRNPLRQLYQLGQSPWYDNIERRLFKSGEFTRLINEYGIVGVTSNPTIFEKAIRSSSDYDEQMRSIGRATRDPYRVYDELTIEDVGSAADMLYGVYQKTNGVDGYVSIEVLPEYAYDSSRTVDYAKVIFKRLGRKNILIKVPGTREGCAAITELIGGGVNVNVTLLFSVRHYEAVAQAYIDGLKKRLGDKKSLSDVTSVASVFVSRVDSRIDPMLEDIAQKEKIISQKEKVLDLRGKAAVANSKIIYGRFKEIFWGEEFEALKTKGAALQRVLWASTSTKNPNYRDVKYVEELIGPHSINTMPHQTVLAFHEHGIVAPSIEDGREDPETVFSALASLGINIDDVCQELQKAGIKAFCDSFNLLINTIERKFKV